MDWLNVIPKDPAALFQWLVSLAALAFIVTQLYERWKWFQAKSTQFKFWFVFASAFVIPLLGYLGQFLLFEVGPTVFPQPVLPLGQPAAAWILWVYAFIVQSLANWASLQIAHALDPNAGKPAVI